MNFEQAAGNDLVWREPQRRSHEVTCNGEVVAALRFEKGWGSLATGECGQTQWTFKRTGFLSPRITVRQVGSETDIAGRTRPIPSTHAWPRRLRLRRT